MPNIKAPETYNVVQTLDKFIEFSLYTFAVFSVFSISVLSNAICQFVPILFLFCNKNTKKPNSAIPEFIVTMMKRDELYDKVL